MMQSGWLLLAAWVWPLFLAWPTAGQGGGWRLSSSAAVSAKRAAPRRGYLVILGALPGLAAALLLPVGTRLELPWLFLGTALELDPTAQVYLLFTALLWLVASIYTAFSFRGTENAGRFGSLFLMAMAGNLWLIVGQDLFSFYAGFAMMGLASYGLVIHDGTPTALRAGKVYLVMALLGEVSLFAALVMIAQQAGTTEPTPEDLTQLTALPIALALVGLGVKAGLVPLHLWLPLAHPAAPVPASAVLSGTMIKVALLGWMRFLPVGAIAMPQWGSLLAGGGLLTLFYAVPVGLVQSDPKAVLAYSSVSKMGLLMLMLGVIMMEPALAPVGIAAIALYAAGHALAKGGLFLGVGLRKHAPLAPGIVQPLVLGGLVFLALALVGAPFTSGATAKYALKPVIDAAAWPWLSAALAVGTVATTLLMSRFIWISVRTRPHAEPGYLWPGLAWAVLIALVALFPFVLGKAASWSTNAVTVPLGVLLAALVAVAAWSNPAWLKPLVGLIPPGDLVVLSRPIGRLAVGLWERLWGPVERLAGRTAQFATHRYRRLFADSTRDPERGLRSWPVAGGLWIGILALLVVALLSGAPLLDGTAEADFDGDTPAPKAIERQTPAEPVLSQGAAERVEAARPAHPARPVHEERPLARTAAEQEAERVEPVAPDRAAIERARDAERAVPPPEADSARESTPAPDLCDPTTSYVFSVPNDGELRLERCSVAGDGRPQPLTAPSLSPELIAAVQRALKRQDHDPGPVDGLMGPRTRDAIAAFQRTENLTATGEITFTLLDRLQGE